MNHNHPNSRLGTALIFLALVAGGITAQFVPDYKERTTVQTQQSARAANANTGSDASNDVTGIDVDQRQMNFVQKTI